MIGAVALQKHYRDVAEILFAKHLKNATMEEKTEEVDGVTVDCIEVLGDFQVLDLNDMDLWGGYFKFVLRDMEAKDDEAIEARGWIAMQVPELAAMMTARTAMLVYRRVQQVKRTTTIVETLRDGKIVDRTEHAESEETEMWEDITREFVRRGQAQFGWK